MRRADRWSTSADGSVLILAAVSACFFLGGLAGCLLAGCVDPDLKSAALQEKFQGVTPAETIKAMLLPGEISDLSIAVEKLSGYRRTTIEEVKNG